MEATKTARHNLIKKVGDETTNAQLFTKELSWATIEKKLATEEGKKFWNEIGEAIGDDLNTSKLIAIINSSLVNMNDEVRSMLYRLEKNFLKVGLFETIVEEKFDIPAEVTTLADQRFEAKKNKDYTLADELRGKITAL
jgi:cysteinyl-tRNA synthetase